MKKYFMSVLLLTVFLCAYAQTESPSGGSPSIEALRRQQKERQRQFLQELKNKDINAYNKEVQRIKREEAKQKIIDDYREGKINLAAARQALLPLVKEEVNLTDELKTIEIQLERFQQQIQRMKKLKDNPNLIIQNKVDTYLGVSGKER